MRKDILHQVTSSGQHASSNLINEVGQVCVDLTRSRDHSWKTAKRVLTVGSVENKGYLGRFEVGARREKDTISSAMCLVDSIVRHERKHKCPEARCSFADFFSDHVCRLTRRVRLLWCAAGRISLYSQALSVYATDSELMRMGKMLNGWVIKKRFDSAVRVGGEPLSLRAIY